MSEMTPNDVTGARQGKVALVDRRTLTRQCLARWLEVSGLGFEIVALSELDELERMLADEVRFDLVLLSVGSSMVTDPDVELALDCLDARQPEVPVIVLSDREDVDAILAAIRRGVRGYIPTTLNLPVAIEALRLVQVGGTFLPASSVLQALDGRHGMAAVGDVATDARADCLPGMTPRQSEVLDLLRQGKTNKIIAYELDMQESTVKVHIRQIMRKLKATNRTQAAFLAQKLLAGHAEAVEAAGLS